MIFRIFITLLLAGVALLIFTRKQPQPKHIEVKAPPMDIDYERSMALSYLNSLRQNAGMSRYKTNTDLQKAATAHAHYLIQNRETGHYESLGKPGFSGKTPQDRVLKTDYQIGKVVENISVNSQDYKDSIDGLFSAIYHRFGFLDFESDEIGIGIVQNSADTDQNAFVYDMGIYELNNLCREKSYNGRGKYIYHICKDPDQRISEEAFRTLFKVLKASCKKRVIFPYDNQQDVPPAFYTETPDPLPDYDVSGFPVSIQFNSYYYPTVKLLSFKLYKADGSEVPCHLMNAQNDPNGLFKPTQYALFPTQRLAYDQEYKAVVKYTSNHQIQTESWHFHTQTLPQPSLTVIGDQGELKIHPYTRYTIYFKPNDPHDTLSDLHFPADAEVKFLDRNTISLTLTSENRESFEIKGGKKVLRVEVK